MIIQIFDALCVLRNALAKANATRPWQLYADFAQHLIGIARPRYATEPFGVEVDAAVYAFDATTIDLCQFQWHSHVFKNSISPLMMKGFFRFWKKTDCSFSVTFLMRKKP